MIWHTNRSDGKKICIIKNGKNFVYERKSLVLRPYEEVIAYFDSAEKIDNQFYLLLNCCNYFRVPVDLETYVALRHEIGKIIALLQTEKTLKVRVQENKDSIRNLEEAS